MAKSLRDRILEALKKGALNRFDLFWRLGVPMRYVRDELSRLKEKGLVEYDISTDKWHLKRK